MSGWLYLIQNGDLYKIGITRNFQNRMRQLKPDYVVAKLHTHNFKQLEKELHIKYKNVRIPQTEYFRLDQLQIREIKKKIKSIHFSRGIVFYTFINSLKLLICISTIIFIYFSLSINDNNIVLFSTFLFMEKLAYIISLSSFFIQSNKYLGLMNEAKYRLSKIIIYFLYALFFRFIYIVINYFREI